MEKMEKMEKLEKMEKFTELFSTEQETLEESKHADFKIMKDAYYDMADAMKAYTRKLYYELDLLTDEEVKGLWIDVAKEREIIKKIEKLFNSSKLGGRI